MCGRFVQFSDPEVYVESFHLEETPEFSPRFNIAPTQPVLAIRQGSDAKRSVAALRWGLVPAWSKDPDSRYSMINARAETVHSKPAYRTVFRRRRCLIPSEGFYEWQAGGNGKQPYFICMQDRRPFAMAGLWESLRDETGDILESCTIIVTEANPLIRPVHERMPVILPAAAYATWLDPAQQDPAILLPLLRPYPEQAMHLHPVSKRVNSPRNQGRDLLEGINTG